MLDLNNIKEKKFKIVKGLEAKYMFAFLIASNPVTGKPNYRHCIRNSMVKKRGIIYNPDTKKYLAFDFTSSSLRYRDNLTEREAMIYLRHENEFTSP